MSMGHEHTVGKTLADPQYRAGRKLINDNRLEEAVEFFSGLLETKVAVLNNEMHPALAPLYYEYGSALLYNAEESGAVFGDAITDAEKQRALALLEGQAQQQALLAQSKEGASAAGGAATGGNGAADGGSGSAAEGEDAAPAVTEGQEAEEDLEIAWENLEMARRIYETLELTDELRVLVGKVHLRLGDLNMVNGMYNEAGEEFQKCLQHRKALPEPVSRGVADAHVRRAQALFYASTLEGADKNKLVASSLEQYRSAAGVFEHMLTALKEESKSAKTVQQAESPGKENTSGEERPAEQPSAPGTGAENGQTNGTDKGKGKEKNSAESATANGNGAKKDTAQEPQIVPGSAEDLQDVLDTIRETIETLVSGKDMEALAEYKSGAVPSTTVGFGASSSASGGASGSDAAAAAAAAGEMTTIGFGAPTATSANGGQTQTGFGVPSASAGAGSGASVMVVKRKGRPTPKMVASEGGAVVGAGNGATGVGGGDDAAKRAKNKA